MPQIGPPFTPITVIVGHHCHSRIHFNSQLPLLHFPRNLVAIVFPYTLVSAHSNYSKQWLPVTESSVQLLSSNVIANQRQLLITTFSRRIVLLLYPCALLPSKMLKQFFRVPHFMFPKVLHSYGQCYTTVWSMSTLRHSWTLYLHPSSTVNNTLNCVTPWQWTTLTPRTVFLTSFT